MLKSLKSVHVQNVFPSESGEEKVREKKKLQNCYKCFMCHNKSMLKIFLSITNIHLPLIFWGERGKDDNDKNKKKRE